MFRIAKLSDFARISVPRRSVLSSLLLTLLLTIAGSHAVQAADGRVQELRGTVFPGELYYYRLDDLEAGEQSVRLHG